jgi:hypothetical protein
MAQLSAEVEQEIEVLRAIYSSDFEDRPPVWGYPSFSIKLTHTSSVDSKMQIRVAGENFSSFSNPSKLKTIFFQSSLLFPRRIRSLQWRLRLRIRLD